MTCSSCGARRGRRDCPALGATICAICCGTKRLVEIACPDACPHLATARVHPASAVKRQQERDVAALMPSISHLTERQHQLFFLFHTLFARHKPEGFSRLVDEDVAQAAASMAATLETAMRGVIYEHTPASRPAQDLAREMTTMVSEMRGQGAKLYDGEAAVVLRAIERGVRDAQKVPGTDETSYLTLVRRLLQVGSPAVAPEPAPKSSLILP